MRCEKCQNELKSEFQFCPNCGHPIQWPQKPPEPSSSAKPEPVKNKMDTATKSIIFAGLGWVVPCIGWIFAILGLIFGFQALNKIKSGEEPANNKILAVIAIIICFFHIVLMFLASMMILGIGLAVFFANMSHLGYW